MHVKKVQCKLMKKKISKICSFTHHFSLVKLTEKKTNFLQRLVVFTSLIHLEYLAQFFNVSSGPTEIQNPRKC